jgi:hypothetical protein
MKRTVFPLTVFCVLVLSALTAYGQPCGVHCGAERWKVKNLTDSTVGNIDQDEIEKSINWLRTRTRPAHLPNTSRLVGIETMTFKVVSVVMTFKREDDKDYVVIAQSNNHNRTMIVEFSDPQCDRVCSSGFLDRMRQAREAFVAQFGEPTPDFQDQPHPIKVEIVEIGFFDRMHGQRGRALPSGIEIHPVLSFPSPTRKLIKIIT